MRWSTTTAAPPLALNMAHDTDPRIETAMLTGRTTLAHSTRVKAYQQAHQYREQDIPYIWFTRDTRAVIANSKVQNFANPKTVQGTKAEAFDEGVLWPMQMWVK